MRMAYRLGVIIVLLILPAVAQAGEVQSDWSGFYLGAQAGWRGDNTDWRATLLRDGPICCGGVQAPIDSSSPWKTDLSSFRGGGYTGYNWQSAQWVYGIEGDFAWANADADRSGLPGCSAIPSGCILGFGAVPPTRDSASVDAKWDASLRARLGFLVAPSILLYGTSGVAWEKVETTGVCGGLTSLYCGVNSTDTADSIRSNDSILTGWTIGAGIEGKLTSNWLLRLEYRYADFGQEDGVFHFHQDGTADNTYRYKIEDQDHIVTVGIAYRFAP